ncbi:tRNA G18 (ribose-2'-O)-methylase SpoU [Hamadaea flava]|uniref:TrmH family RNA methyltransferase n=1 Tax=Hamadaea flava TaxID=1742688 RepID=A0ABV8LJ24_9ACTN|nr:TrmH family RNA methyltransferase [Hamadaea flava]MCP2325576.1 tRNA G18 (ribose-2'-O)-methylase SpoU [Hamadaea flava]
MPSELEKWYAHRDRPDVVLVDGFHAVKHALRFGADVLVVLATDKPAAMALAHELAPDLAGAFEILAEPVTPAVLAELVSRPHPTGVAALALRPSLDFAALAGRTSPVVLLEDPRHLGNIGAVVRLAAGFGVTGVVTTGVTDPWHPAAIRGSAGLHFATAVGRVDLDSRPAGPVYVLDPDGTDIRDLRFPDDAVLAFGTERHGVSDQLRSVAAQLVAIPMRTGVSSFNLATSVAMALFHWTAARPA